MIIQPITVRLNNAPFGKWTVQAQVLETKTEHNFFSKDKVTMTKEWRLLNKWGNLAQYVYGEPHIEFNTEQEARDFMAWVIDRHSKKDE